MDDSNTETRFWKFPAYCHICGKPFDHVASYDHCGKTTESNVCCGCYHKVRHSIQRCIGKGDTPEPQQCDDCALLGKTCEGYRWKYHQNAWHDEDTGRIFGIDKFARIMKGTKKVEYPEAANRVVPGYVKEIPTKKERYGKGHESANKDTLPRVQTVWCGESTGRLFD